MLESTWRKDAQAWLRTRVLGDFGGGSSRLAEKC